MQGKQEGKRKLFAIDAFTNGHAAALKFMREKGWTHDDTDIIFCRTNANVLACLSEHEGYAVVPVHNTTNGDIGEVVGELDRLRSLGYELSQVGKAELHIRHCLLAPRHIADACELTSVVSHEQAIRQCSKTLAGLGIHEDKWSFHESTGNAAKFIAKQNGTSSTGAIASEEAADHYGLNVLERNVQDMKDNRTTFLLLQNELKVRRRTVGIVGIHGKYGTFLANYFSSLGCDVVGYDIAEKPSGWSMYPTLGDLVYVSDVVIFAVLPNDQVPDLIRSVSLKLDERKLVMDVTSLKAPAVSAMLESKAQAVGLHPMFRPGVSPSGQTVVVCPARLTNSWWKTWLVNVLARLGVRLKWSDEHDHDAYMLYVQGSQHLGTLVNAMIMVDDGISVSESLEYASPFYRFAMSQMGRLLADPSVYVSILMDHPETVTLLKSRMAIERRILEVIEAGDAEGLTGFFESAQEHFGSEVIGDASELFTRMLSVHATVYGKNAVIFEISNADDKPGILGRIMRVFSDRDINITAVNTVKLNGSIQFAFDFSQSKWSEGIRMAIEEIEGWTDLNVTVK